MALALIKKKLITPLLNQIYPSKCPVCGKEAEDSETQPLCASCWEKIKRYEGPSCRVCGRHFDSKHGTICGDCISDKPPFERAMSYGLYEGNLKEAIHLLKYTGIKRLAGPLGGLMAEAIARPPLHPSQEGNVFRDDISESPSDDWGFIEGMGKEIVVVSVPMSRRELAARGFNQSFLIARSASTILGVQLLEGVLYKSRETAPQVRLNAKERAVNLKKAFAVRRRLSGERILLVDDVMTTGATVSECSKTLLRAGASAVYAATLARGV